MFEWLSNRLLLMRDMCDLVTERKSIAKQKMKHQFDKNARLRAFKQSDMVLVKHLEVKGKFECAWAGPFQMMERQLLECDVEWNALS